MSLKNFLRKASSMEQKSWNGTEINTSRGKLEKTKLDLTHALSQYEKSSKNKHDMREKYIEQLIASWEHIDDDTAWEMINSWEENLLVDKLNKCRGLSFYTARHLIKNRVDSVLKCMNVLNYWAIKKWEKEPNYTKISVFAFDEDDYKRLISYCIDMGKWDHVICHINDFYTWEQIYNENSTIYNFTLRQAEPMFDVSYIEEIFRKLLSRDESAFNYALYLRDLQKYYHWLIDPEIALMLINKGNEYATKYVAKELSLFRHDKNLIYKLVEMGYWNEIKAEWISWFEWEEYKEVVRFLVDHWVKL